MRRLCIMLTVGCVGLFMAVTGAYAAPEVYLSLQADGEEIEGESDIESLDRGGSIVCFQYEESLDIPVVSGLAASRIIHNGITCRKRIDKSSPLLMQALTQNQVVEGTFRFFRTNAAGRRTVEEHYHTVAFTGGRIIAIQVVSPSTLDKKTGSLPAFENVTFVAHGFVWTSETGGASFEWTVPGGQ